MKSSLLRQFRNYILKENLFEKKDKIILAVSGGIDSVAMCQLFYLARFQFAIAHCNFHLRGDESDEDSVFVKQLAEKYKVPFFITDFNTTEYARSQGISIEMAARDLRYNWFDELLKKQNYQYVAIAHQLDDSVETFFINLLRGTGIAGLHGIQPKQNKFIRPLLFITREELEHFIKKEKLEYRQDSTNQSTEIRRNFIRHKIIPLFKEMNPAFLQTMQENMERLKETESIFRKIISHEIPLLVDKKNDKIHIPIEKLKQRESSKIFLFEILTTYGFNSSAIEDIAKSLNDISGKQFFSPSHRLVRDRKYLIITPLQSAEKNGTLLIDSTIQSVETPVKLSISQSKNSKHQISKNNNIASLDFDKLKFPLEIRRWRKGDFFYPFGMNGKKKLSDFFIDNKFSILEKENAWLLCSENKIVWLIGHRIDNRFRITHQTKKVYKIELL